MRRSRAWRLTPSARSRRTREDRPMSDGLTRTGEALARAAAGLDFRPGLRLRGVVRRVGDDVAFAAGLEEAGYEELVAFDSGGLGMAYELRADGSTGIVLLS